MQKSSQIAILVCVLIVGVLGATYFASRTGEQSFTKEKAQEIVTHLQEAVASKNVDGILTQIDSDPETRIAGITPDQLRLLLSRGFRAMSQPRATASNLNMASNEKGEATMDFDLQIGQTGQDHDAVDYKGHVTFHLKRIEVSHMFGLYKTRDWRIVGGSTTGPQPGEMGE